MRLFGVTEPPWQPPLTTRARLTRFAVTLSIGLISWSVVVLWQIRERPDLLLLDLVVGAIGLVAVEFRRKAPFPVMLLLAACGPLSTLSHGAGVLAGMSLSTYRVGWQIVIMLCLYPFTTWLYLQVMSETPLRTDGLFLPVTVASVAVLTLAGMYIGFQRETLYVAQQRLRLANRFSSAEMDEVRATERVLIAREMQETLTSDVAGLKVAARRLGQLVESGETDVRDRADALQQHANATLTDLRMVLGVLRADTDAPDTPVAGLEQVVRLAEEVDRRGLPTVVVDELDWTDASDCPSEPVGRAVYRVVEACLTDSLVHAPGGTAEVRLSGDRSHGLTLRVHHPMGPMDESRAAARITRVAGLQERCDLLGGRITADIDGDSCAVEVWLPWQF